MRDAPSFAPGGHSRVMPPPREELSMVKEKVRSLKAELQSSQASNAELRAQLEECKEICEQAGPLTGQLDALRAWHRILQQRLDQQENGPTYATLRACLETGLRKEGLPPVKGSPWPSPKRSPTPEEEPPAADDQTDSIDVASADATLAEQLRQSQIEEQLFTLDQIQHAFAEHRRELKAEDEATTRTLLMTWDAIRLHPGYSRKLELRVATALLDMLNEHTD